MAHKVLVFALAGAAAATPLYPAHINHAHYPRDGQAAQGGAAGTGTGVSGPTGTGVAGPTGTGGVAAPTGSKYKCGPVEEFWNPTQKDWVDAKTDQYLSDWIKDNQGNISNHKGTGGFASAFAQYAFGKTDVTCKMDGSTDCNFDACANPIINSLPGNDDQHAFYVSQSMKNLHSYFQGLTNAFQMSSLLAAFNADGWTKTFYKKGDGHDADDTEDHGITALKEIFNVLAVVVGVACAFVAPETIPAIAALEAAGQKAIAGGIGGATSAIVGGGVGAANIAIKAQGGGSNNFAKAADVKTTLGKVISDSLTGLVSNNDKLMAGESIDEKGSTIANFLDGGGFLNASINEVDVMKGFNSMLTGIAINRLWRQNKIFILGGGKCDDSDGIGKGPQNAKWCDQASNTAWYLYFWQGNDVISLTAHQWGWVAQPPGMDALGKDSYADIKVENVIESSVKAFRQAGNDYTPETANNRMMDAVTGGKENPLTQGATWEGIFTIPVCDMGKAIPTNIEKKQNILMDFGHDNRPNWCGNICGNDKATTATFINRANMDKFESPQHYCSKKPEWYIGK